MDFDDTSVERAFRAEARAWIAANAPVALKPALVKTASRTTSNVEAPALDDVDPIEASRAWQRKKYDGGWACLLWPREHGGREARPIEQVIWQQEEGVYAQLSDLFAVGHGMAGPTILEHGTEAQKARYLRPIASGETLWCQLFSEPSGGSDLAALRSRAEPVDGGWRLNGQKIWTTHAQIADFGILIARTDPNVPKHAGLTMFVIDMRSPGIEIRPIRQMTGGQTFNEVFLTDVFVPADNIIGAAGNGWRVSLTTLMNERLRLAASIPTAVPELLQFCRQFAGDRGAAIADPQHRARLASWIARASGLRFTMMRTISALSQGREPGPENSIGKLVAGDIVQDLAAFALDLQGPAGAVLDTSDDGQFQKMLLSAAKIRVGGGTAEIQRNIIGERVLGLPPEMRADKELTFAELAAAGR